jgi:hypothetical protein
MYVSEMARITTSNDESHDSYYANPRVKEVEPGVLEE